MKGSTFHCLMIFHCIVQEGSIRGAARRLEMSAPTVSLALKQLEQTLGLALFRRTTRSMELTEAGQQLHDQTGHAMATLDGALERVGQHGRAPAGKVRVTLPRFVFQSFLQPLYAGFCRQYPEIEPHFSGSDEQARGPVNVTSALIKNTCYFGLMAMTDASLPFNHGFVDVVRTRFKEGTIVCPRFGAPVSYYVPLAYLTADVVLHALGKFNPERAVGSSGGGGGVRITSSGGKSGKAGDVADVIALLVSDAARHVTGSPVWIDGGQSLLR